MIELTGEAAATPDAEAESHVTLLPVTAAEREFWRDMNAWRAAQGLPPVDLSPFERAERFWEDVARLRNADGETRRKPPGRQHR